MKKTYQEILEVLQNFYSNVREFAYGDWPVGFYEKYKDLSYEDRKKQLKTDLGLGEFTEVDHYGGEGQGEDWHSVFHFKDHDVYIRVDGFYSSYEGVDFYEGWECCSEVRPKEKTITVYEA